MGKADGYLNKKSWHPGSKRNLEKVWKLEEEAKIRKLEEEVRAKQVREERDWERERDLTGDEAAKRRGGVAWMYQSAPSTSAKPNTEDGTRQDKRRTQGNDDPARSQERLTKMLDGIRSGITSANGDPNGSSYGYVGVGCEDEEDEEDAFRIARLPEAERRKELKRIEKRRRKQKRREKEEARRARVAEAERVLEEAGLRSRNFQTSDNRPLDAHPRGVE